MRKPLLFEAGAYESLIAFPAAARREAGHELDLVQQGQPPDDWKPMPTIGIGVSEIRIRNQAGAYRVIYVAKFEEAVYVLHCFEKKSQRTSRPDLDLASARYKTLVRRRSRR